MLTAELFRRGGSGDEKGSQPNVGSACIFDIENFKVKIHEGSKIKIRLNFI